MTSPFPSLLAAQQIQLELAQVFGRQTIEASRRLLALNLQTLRTLFGDGGLRLQAVADGDSPLAADEDMLAPARQAVERSTAYWVRACEIVAEAQQELAALAQQHATTLAGGTASPLGGFATVAAFGLGRPPAPEPQRTIETAQAAFEHAAGAGSQASSDGGNAAPLLN